MMNIYLLNEDGNNFCIKAKTMHEAIKVCEISYLEEQQEEKGERYNIYYATKYYHEQILQSCSLVGELKN